MNSSWVTSLIVIRDLGKFSYFYASCFVNFRATVLLHLLYFSTYSGIKTLPYLIHMLRAQYIGMSLATVICECSLTH